MKQVVYLGGDPKKYWCETGKLRKEKDKRTAANSRCIMGRLLLWTVGPNPAGVLLKTVYNRDSQVLFKVI